MRPADGEAGFTLVETLVGLTIVALLASLVLAFAGQLGRIAALEPSLAERREAETIARFIADRMGDARLLGTGTSGLSVRPLVGTSDEALFVAPIRTGLRGRVLRTIRVREDDRRLLLIAAPRRPLSDDPPPDPEVLAKGVDSLRLRYLGSGAGVRSERIWRDDWVDRPDLPEAVSVELTIARDGRTTTGRAVAIIEAAR